MAAIIKIKRSEVASNSPGTDDLVLGEVAINTADKKIFIRDSNGIVTIGNIVDDTTPQLGGDLDVNGNNIVSTSNGDINISPNGTGSVVIDTDLDVDNINLNGNTISSINADGDINISPNGAGIVNASNLNASNLTINSAYSFPTSDGSANQILKTDGSGSLTFANESSGSSSGENISYSVTQSSHGFSVSDVLYFDGTSYAKAQADDSTTLGLFLVSSVTDTNNFTVTLSGKVTGLSSLTAGEYYFLSNTTAGALTTTTPTTGYNNPILFAISATEGIILPYRPFEVEDNTNNASTVNVVAFSIALG